MREILLDWSNFCALANLEVLRREIEIRKFCNWVTQEKWFLENESHCNCFFINNMVQNNRMNFKWFVWWSILCEGGWLLYLVIYLLLVSVCIKFSRGLWKWKTNIGWECGAITGLLGRVENLFLIKLHILWKQLKAFTNVIWNNWCKYFWLFSLLVLTGMTDSFSLRLRLEFSPLQHFINLCVTMGHLSYSVSKDCVKNSHVLFIMKWLVITNNINMKKTSQ